jgi:hypothetical protein
MPRRFPLGFYVVLVGSCVLIRSPFTVVVSRSTGRHPPPVPRTDRSAEQPMPAATTAADDLPAATASADPGSGNPADPAAAGLRRLRLAVTVLGPITIVTALLYYYGYVTTYAEYAYFGVNVELLSYSSADYVLRSPASVFAPLLVLLVLVGLGYWAHVSLAGWDLQTTHPRRARVVFWVAIVGGAALLFRAALGIVDGNLSARELIGTTPAALGLGTLLALYSFRFRPARQPTSGPGQTSIAISTVAWVIGWCFVIASLFWLVNSFASAYGRGIGQDIQKGHRPARGHPPHSQSAGRGGGGTGPPGRSLRKLDRLQGVPVPIHQPTSARHIGRLVLSRSGDLDRGPGDRDHREEERCFAAAHGLASRAAM